MVFYSTTELEYCTFAVSLVDSVIQLPFLSVSNVLSIVLNTGNYIMLMERQ